MKSDAVGAFRRFFADAVIDGKFEIIRSGGGAEVKGKFGDLCDEHQITHDFTIAISL